MACIRCETCDKCGNYTSYTSSDGFDDVPMCECVKIDHKELLKKYIEYIKQCEGSDYLWILDEEFDEFTKEESTELHRLSGGGE